MKHGLWGNMMPRFDRAAICLAGAGVLCGGVMLFAQAASPTSAPATQPVEIKPVFAAMVYFDFNCARCHGPQGSFYGKEFGQHLSDATLTKVVRDMAEGPGNAPLNAEDLKVEVAYHRALAGAEPFVSITAVESDTLRGEVSPGSSVTVDGKPAKVEGFNWSAPMGAEIVAMRGDKKTVLRAADAYSHQQPIPQKK